MKIFIVGCVAVVILALATFISIIGPMDSYLNYSMIKKIKTKGLPLYFPSDRAKESFYGPSLEDPNEGTYLPAFICSIVTYSLSLVLLIMMIVIQFVVKSELVTNVVVSISFIAMFINAVICLILRERYKKKYFLHKEEWINKIKKIKTQHLDEK